MTTKKTLWTSHVCHSFAAAKEANGFIIFVFAFATFAAAANAFSNFYQLSIYCSSCIIILSLFFFFTKNNWWLRHPIFFVNIPNAITLLIVVFKRQKFKTSLGTCWLQQSKAIPFSINFKIKIQIKNETKFQTNPI